MRRSRGTVVVAVVAVVVLGGLAWWLWAAPSGTSSGRAPSAPSTSAPGPVGQGASRTSSGWWYASGTRIVDAGGQVVQPTGLNVTGMESSNPQGSDLPGTCNNAWKQLSAAEVADIASYGFGTVRLPIAWANLEPTAPTVAADGSLTHTWNQAYVSALDSEIQMFTARRIRVILDMHQATWSSQFVTGATSARPGCPGTGMPAWLNPDAPNETANHARCEFLANRTEPGVPGTDWGDFEAAWTYLARQYATTPTVVGLDILNEPSCQSVGLDGFFGAVTPVVHAADPHALLLVEDKEQPGTYQLTKMPSVPNVVLSIHLHEDYWSTPSAGQATQPSSGQAVMEANVARARQWDVPLYVGEFYAFDAALVQQKGKNQRDANFAADTASFLAYARAHDVGWTYWAWIAQKQFQNQVSLPANVRAALSG